MKDMYNTAADTHISQWGIPNGMRASITIGDVKGIIENQNAAVVLGSVATLMENTSAIIIGIMANDWSWDASCMLSTAEPIAANIEA